MGKTQFNHISRRILGQMAVDAMLIVLATLTAYLVKFDTDDQVILVQHTTVALTLPVLLALRLLCLYVFRLYRIHWRYVSVPDLWLLVGAVTSSSALFYAYLTLRGYGAQSEYSWGVQVINWGISLFLLGLVRSLYRELPESSLLDGNWLRDGIGKRSALSSRQRALIVGASDAGEMVARALKRRPEEGIVPVGFVDDNPLRHGIQIQGLSVFGGTYDISELAVRYEVDIILIAIPGVSGSVLRDIVSRCEQTTARICIFPSVGELLEGNQGRPAFRDVNIEDLLRRDPVQTDMSGIAQYISGQRVLVTGAGGSIGSELCRQIVALNPARLLLVGHGENSIFEIEQELIREFNYAPTALIGDVKDRKRIEEIFLQERPTVVLRAAAHKHVPLMEANPQEAIKNNVLGTRNVAEIAAECGVKKFILVSTDKAVNPTSVMGATKRICEMLVQSMAGTCDTGFAAVRFGNVLGSRGSVIPTMQKQIARGGPVTVTDPKMTRYFMTIPEAVQLILQAGALCRSGEIFLLDMGEPVRILDLARDLIRLSGYRPDVDIKIEYTGIRPGEKLHEELLYTEEEKERTTHEKISVFRGNGVCRTSLLQEVDHLFWLVQEGELGEVLRNEIMRVAQGQFESHELPRRTRHESVENLPHSIIEGVPFS
ncbi:MAG: nucleoside-diphosphate sugar epimerase/dehydratase [Armatimonadaceae bacterium]